MTLNYHKHNFIKILKIKIIFLILMIRKTFLTTMKMKINKLLQMQVYMNYLCLIILIKIRKKYLIVRRKINN